jgi:hypothetical protein
MRRLERGKGRRKLDNKSLEPKACFGPSKSNSTQNQMKFKRCVRSDDKGESVGEKKDKSCQ